jgi:hypothetical protein
MLENEQMRMRTAVRLVVAGLVAAPLPVKLVDTNHSTILFRIPILRGM